MILALAAVGMLAALPVLYGMLAQAWAVAHDGVSTSGPPGRLVGVGGHTVHLECLGETRGPTVVLESGLATTSRIWRFVQPALAEITRACSYDRPGYGWSGRPRTARTAEAIATELWSLLDQAGERGPFVLVGHSAGGLYVRAALALRPQAVAGLVLIDPTPEDLSVAERAEFASLARGFRREGSRLRWGWAHLPVLGETLPLRFPDYPLEEQRVLDAMYSRPSFLFAVAEELELLATASAAFVRAHRESMRGTPIVLLTRSLHITDFGARVEQPPPGRLEWRAAHEAVAALSRSGQLIAAEESGHDIHVDQPELVIEAIVGVVAAHRGAAGHPT